MKKNTSCLLVVMLALVSASTVPAVAADEKEENGFISLFNGQDFTGWKIGDKEQAKWKVENGRIVAIDIVSHFCRFANNHPCSVVNKEALAYSGSRVDFDSR